jgi:hypothetical protein
MSLFCFLDGTYLCVCGKKNYRAECFNYDHHLDQCSHCLAGGRCLKGDPFRIDDFVCVCPLCHSGRFCQFSSEALSFSLDSFIVENRLIIQLLYLTFTIIMFFVGTMTNYASFLTFKRPNMRKLAVCNYLLILSLINQCCLLSLLLKTVFIPIGSSSNISCKLISYALSVFTRYSGWLTSWVTIERVCLVSFPFSTLLNKPRLAIILSCTTLIIIAVMHIHKLIVYTAATIPSGETFCVANFGRFSTYNRVTVFIHYIIPFCIQTVSVTVLIVLATRSRSRVTSDRTTIAQLLKRQFKSHKELYITPAIIVLSGISHITLTFSLACNAFSAAWQQHLLTITYFLSYSPQLLGFVLFVLPSTNYLKEFRKTPLAKKRLFNWAISYKKKLTPHRAIQHRYTISRIAN